MFIKISLIKDVIRFGKKDKLSSRYINPFEITKRIENLVYRLSLLPQMETIYDVFHVSQLRKCLVVKHRVVDLSKVDL